MELLSFQGQALNIMLVHLGNLNISKELYCKHRSGLLFLPSQDALRRKYSPHVESTKRTSQVTSQNINILTGTRTSVSRRVVAKKFSNSSRALISSSEKSIILWLKKTCRLFEARRIDKKYVNNFVTRICDIADSITGIKLCQFSICPVE